MKLSLKINWHNKASLFIISDFWEREKLHWNLGWNYTISQPNSWKSFPAVCVVEIVIEEFVVISAVIKFTLFITSYLPLRHPLQFSCFCHLFFNLFWGIFIWSSCFSTMPWPNSSLIKFLSSLDPCMPLQQQQKLDSLHHIIIIIHASVLKQQQYYQQQQHIYRSICVKHYIVGPGPWPSKLVSWPGLCCDIRRQISVLFVGKKKRWLVSLNESVGARLEACSIKFHSSYP